MVKRLDPECKQWIIRKTGVHSEKANLAAKLLRLYENTTRPDLKRQCLEMISSLTLPGSVQVDDDVTTYDLISVDDLPNRRSETASAFQRRTFDGWAKKGLNTRGGTDLKNRKSPPPARVQSSTGKKCERKKDEAGSNNKSGGKIRRSQSVMSMTSYGRADEKVEKSAMCEALSLEDVWRCRSAYKTSYQRQFTEETTYHPVNLGRPASVCLMEATHQPITSRPYSAQHIDLTKKDKSKKVKEKSVASISLPVPKLNSVTKYGEDFYEKKYSKRDPIRSGTSSGTRKNNPHPKKDFILWHKAHKNVPPEPHEIIRVFRPPESKCRTNLAEGEDYKMRKGEKEKEYAGRKLSKDRSGNLKNHPGVKIERPKTSEDLTDRGVERAIKDRSRSVYQVDYLGAPLGVNLRTAFFDVSGLNRAGVKPGPPKTIDTNCRISYQKPKAQPIDLQLHTDRYGCNANFLVPALGVVPTLTSGDVDVHRVGHSGTGRTTYTREYTAKRPFTAPGTRFGNAPYNKFKLQFNKEPEVLEYINSERPDENIELDKDEIFRRARNARINESLTYRQPLTPTSLSVRQPIKYWAGPE